MEEDHDDDHSPPSQKLKRPRANTDQSEDTLTAAEKEDLLSSFPVDELDKASHHDGVALGPDRDNKDDDLIEMFGSGSESDSDGDIRQPAKRRRIDDAAESQSKAEVDARKEKLIQQAKGRLSKWAARLFDPDRPRGLVEAPEVIPLNDEFLISFGKREKEFDNATGNGIELDDDDLDNMDGITSDKEGEDGVHRGKGGAKNGGKGIKVSCD